MKAPIVVVVLTTVSTALAWGCSTVDRLGVEIERPPEIFVVEDAGADADVERGLTSYCPSSKCPAGWTTCPSSRFPCDVNLLTDLNNCGACGRACPPGTATENFSCIDGACVMQCSATPLSLDCDGLADNGCEARPLNDEHCGACGKKCTDPAKPCANQSIGINIFDCGCRPDELHCDRFCVDRKNDDNNCGECYQYCDRAGDGAPALPHAYYGCRDAKCGALKCEDLFASCDNVDSNGCETSLATDANCGSCGNVCPDGQACRLDGKGRPQCMCPPGKTYCQTGCVGDLCTGFCTDLTSDTYNCGACGAGCLNNGLPNSLRTCSYGTCVMACKYGQADCNNSPSDGCEVNTDSDPRNCGGCGRVCDAVAGQACVAGRCVVEPCGSEDAGVIAK